MSLFPLSKLRRFASKVGAFRDTTSGRHTARKTMDRVRRHLVIDPLEERHLLSVSPLNPSDNLVTDGSSANTDQTTDAAQCIAVDDDGDFVIVWERNDGVYDENGNVVVNPFTKEAMTDYNIYARYFTDEVQRITLPESIATDNVGNSWGKFALAIGGSEVQKLTFDKLQMAYLSANWGPTMSGTFDIGFDVDGDGSIGANESFSFTYNESDIEGNVTTLQSQLHGLQGALYDVKVEAIDSQQFYIYFDEEASQGLNQPLIQINPTYTAWTSSESYYPGAYVSTVSEPIIIDKLNISSTDAEATAQLIEQRFAWLTTNWYLTAEVSSGHVGVANGEGDDLYDTTCYGPDSSSYNSYAGFTDWKVEVTPVSGSLTEFDITFTGAASKQNVPDMKFVSIKDDLGNDLLGTSEEIVTIKETSDEFRVNDPEVDNPFTSEPDVTDQKSPAIAMDADGDYVITWQSSTTVGSSSYSSMDIYARRFSPSGWTENPTFVMEDGTKIQGVIALGNSFIVNTNTNGKQDTPAIGMDFDGNFVITWVNTSQNSSYRNSVSAQRYNRDGERLGGEFVVVNPTGTTNTNVHFDPYVSLSDDGYILFTWSETNDAGYVTGTGEVLSTVWAKLYSPNQTVIDTWYVPSIADESTSAFDSKNNFVISGTALAENDTTYGAAHYENSDIYATGYSINANDTGVTVSRNTFRVNSASFDVNAATTWSENQWNSQVMIDADGDITITYQGYAPDTSLELFLNSSFFEDVINNESNPDLVEYIDFVGALTQASGSSFTESTGSTGDIDAEIELYILQARYYGINVLGLSEAVVNEQIGRLRTIINDVVDIYRGDPNAIMFTSLDAKENTANDTILYSDKIVNTERDSSNERYLLYIPSTITDVQAEGGSFTIQVYRGSNPYGDEGFVNTDSEEISITPVFIESVMQPVETAQVIHDRLESMAIFGGNTGASSGNIAVRRIDGSYEWELREGTDWEWSFPETVDANGNVIDNENYYVYEITMQGASHDIPFSISLAPGGNGLTPEGTPSPYFVEYMEADYGLIQTKPSAGMTPDGSFVVAWTQYEEYSNGNVSGMNIYFREYEEVDPETGKKVDAAGPKVTDFLLPSGDRLDNGEQVTSALQNIVVTFSEQLATSGSGSVLDPDNWALMKYDSDGNLVEIRGGITQISFGMNCASDLADSLGLNTLGTNKWEAILTLDGNGTQAGTTSLDDGDYVIVAKSGLRDAADNPLGSSGYAVNGFNIQRSFTVTLPTGNETIVNSETNGAQETLSPTIPGVTAEEFPNSPQAVAGDADGEHVVVWTDNSSANPGVYAKIYRVTWTDIGNDQRDSDLELPIEIQVTDDASAIYASVARDGDGDFVVTWSAKDSTGDWNIWYRTFDAMGRATSEATIVNSELAGYQQFSTVAMDNDGDFVITWQSQAQTASTNPNAPNDSSGYGIYAQRFTRDGVNELQTIELTNADSNVVTFNLSYLYEGVQLKTNDITYNPGTQTLQNLIQAIQSEIISLGLEAEVYRISDTVIGIYYQGNNGYEDMPLVQGEIVESKPLTPELTVGTKAADNSQTFELTKTGSNVIQFTMDFTVSGISYKTGPVTYDATADDPATGLASAIQAELQKLGINATVTTVSGSDTKVNIKYGSGSTGAVLVATTVTNVVSPDFSAESDTLINGKSLYSKIGGVNEVQTLKLVGGIDIAEFTLNFDYGNVGKITGAIHYNTSNAKPLEALIAEMQTQIDLIGVETEVFLLNDTTIAIRYIGADGCKNQSPILIDSETIVGDEGADLKLSTVRNGTTSEFLVNQTTTGNQMWPSIAMNQVGEFVITWTTDGQAGDTAYESNIYARKFDANETVIQDLKELDQTDLGAGTTNTYQISNGMPLGNEFLVNTPYTVETWVPGETEGEFVLVTQQDNAPVQGNQKWSSIAMDADGDFVITWTSYGQDGSGNGYGPGANGENGVFARRFDKYMGDSSASTTTTDYEVFQVNTFVQGAQQHSSVAMDSDGDFIITWESYQEKPTSGTGADSPSSYGIYAQRYVSNGQLGTSDFLGPNGETGGELHVNTTTAGDQRFPSVTMDDNGDAVIVWNGTSSIDSDGGIFLQRFEKLKDDTGPRVTEVQYVSASYGTTVVNQVSHGESIETNVAQMVVTFGEDMNIDFLAAGDNSIFNLDNWELCRLMSNGSTLTISNGVTNVTFGVDEAYKQGLAGVKTGKFQAVVTFDLDPNTAANQELTQGNYVLKIKEDAQDLFGNGIQPNVSKPSASDYEFEFSVKESDTEDTPLDPIDPGDDNGITNGRTYPESPGAVAVDGDGDYVAVWTAYDEALGVDRIYMQRFNSGGSPLWSEPRAVASTGFGVDTQRYATVACDPDGDFVVTWTNYRDEDGSDLNGQEQVDIYACRFSAAGIAQGNAFRVNSYTAGDQIWSNVAMDVEGGFVVTWSSQGQENNGLPGYGYGVYARQFDPLGYALASEFQVNTTTSGDQQFSSVAVAADGTFVIVWQSDQNGVGKDIVSRAFNSDGSPQISQLGGESIVNDTLDGDQIYPDVALDLSGNTYVVTWTSTQGTDDPYGSGIYSKAFSVLSDTETDVRYQYVGDPIDIGHKETVDVTFFIEDGFLIDDINIQLSILHNDPSDLQVWLIGPDGTEVRLFSNIPLTGDAAGVSSGGNGANFTNTTFDDDAETSINDESVLPPFTGTYSPDQALAAFNNRSAYGTWTLRIKDNDPSNEPDEFITLENRQIPNEDGGRLLDFSLDFIRQADISQETLVNTTTTGNQVYSSISMDYNGNYVVVWSGYGDQEDQEDRSEYGVYAQEFVLPGVKLGEETRINQQTLGRQWIPSVGTDAEGNYVTVWTGVGSAAGTTSVYARASVGGNGTGIDTAGPVVGGVYEQSNQLFQGEVLAGVVNQLTFTFNEDIYKDLTADDGSSGVPTESILNFDNWSIVRNGSEIIGGITNIQYGYNPATLKYEATVTFDGNGQTPGSNGLGAGQYSLILRDTVTDVEGNRLDGDYDGSSATNTSVSDTNGYRFRFNIADSDTAFGPEVRANDNVELVQLLSESKGTGQARETSVRSTAIDGNGDYVVVWTSIGQDDVNDPNGKGVYFQLYNADGTEKGSPVRVNNIITGDQQNASVAMDAAGDFVIVWESEQADGTFDIYAQRFNANGSRVANERVDRIDDDPLRGTSGFNKYNAIENFTGRGLSDEDIEVMVNTTQTYNQFNPEVAMDSYGNFIVVWGSAGTAYGYGNKVNIQVFDYDGEPITEEMQVSSEGGQGTAAPGSVAGFTTNPSVAMDDNGRIIVVWDRISVHTSNVVIDTEIVGRIIDLEGNFLTPIFDPTTFLTDATALSGGIIGTPVDSVATSVTSVLIPTMHEGEVVWWQNDLSRTARNPQVAMDSQGNFVVVYEARQDADNDDDDTLFSYGVYYSVYSVSRVTTLDEYPYPLPEEGTLYTMITTFTQTAAGQANTFMPYSIPDDDSGIWSDASIAAMSFVGDQVNPSVAINANGDFAVTWNGPGAEPDPLDETNPELLANVDDEGVWIRWFNLSGQSTTTQKRVNVTQAGKQNFGSVAMNRDGDAVVSWAGAGVGDRHGVFVREYDATADVVGPLATELYHKGENPNVGAGDSYLFVADGDKIYGNPTSLLVVFNEEMDTSEKADNTPGNRSVENVNNWALINGRNEEISGKIDHVDFYFEETLDKWVAEVFFVSSAGLENGTYTLLARTNIYDASGNILGKTGYRPNGTGMNLGYVDPLTGEVSGLIGNVDLLPYNNPTGGFAFQFGVNNTLPGDPNWGDVDQQVNTEEYGREDDAVIARNASGDYVVAWIEYEPLIYIQSSVEESDDDTGDTTSDDDEDDDNTVVNQEQWFVYQPKIMVQRFDFWGRAVGGPIQVNTLSLGAITEDVPLDVAIDDAGNFVVVWSGDNTLIEGEDGIFFQRFDYDGQKMGGQIRVNEYRDDIQTDPSVAMVGATGDFVVSWTSFAQDGNQDAIVARRYNLAGTAQGSEFIVNSYTFGAQRQSDVATDAAGNFVIVWTGEEYNGAGKGIYGRRFNSAGTALGSEFHVNTSTASDQITPAVAMDTQGNFVVTWASYVTGGNNLWDIFARRFNSSGTAQGNNFQVNQTTAYSQIEPDVAMSTGKGFVITWASYNQDYPYDEEIRDYGVFARMFNSDGTNYVDERIGTSPVGEFQVNATTLGDQRSPAVSMDAAGHYVVVWTGPNRPGTVGEFMGTEEGDDEDTDDTGDTGTTSGDDTGTTEDDDEITNLIMNAEWLLEQESTSIYSRLIDPPIVVTASTTPQDVTIMGTSGNDVIEFIGSPNANNWVIKVNGVVRTIGDNIGTLTFDGLGGTDTFKFTGSSEDDSIVLAPGSSSFTSNDYIVVANHFETIVANGGTGDNVVTFQDSSSNDVLTVKPNSAGLVGGGLTLQATNCMTVIATSTSGQDTVMIYDTEGNDTFSASPTSASMSGTGYSVATKGFRYAVGYSTGGTDSANLFDSAGDDQLTTHTAYAKLSGDGFYSIANDFRYICAVASEGEDTARMYDSEGDDEFEAGPGYAKFSTDTYYVRADYFDSVNASGSKGGHNTATFYGTAGDDTFVAGENYGKMTNNAMGFEVRADFFQEVTGRGQGGNDKATLIDTSGDDTLVTTNIFSQLKGPSNDTRAYYFSNVEVYAINGGNNTANLYDSTGNDLLEAEDDWVRMSNAELSYTFKLLSFDQVTAKSSNAGDKKKINESIDFLFAQGYWEDID